MESFFLAFAIFSSVLFVLAIIFDRLFQWMDFDFFDGSFGAVTIFSFMTVFAWVGLGVERIAHWSITPVIVVGIIAGGLTSAFIHTLMRWFSEESGVAIVDDSNMLGMKALVVTNIPAGGYGKIVVNGEGRNSIEVSASSNDSICAGEKVTIESVTGPGLVKVICATTPTPLAAA